MRKLKLLLAFVMFFMLSVSPVFAQARRGLQASDPIETDTSLVAPAGSWLYGIKLYADEASSVLQVYNAAATPTALTGTEDDRIDEIGEATQYDSVEVWYPKPIFCSNGISVKILTGVGIIYTGPAP